MSDSTTPGTERGGGRLAWSDLALFSEQLRSIVASGMPLPAALHTLAQSMNRSRARDAMDAMQSDLKQGISLHSAMERQGDAFPPLFHASVRAGELSGNLPAVLRLLCRYSGESLRTQEATRAALLYPGIVLLTLCGVFLWYTEMVFPEFRDFHAEMGEITWQTNPTGAFIALFANRGIEAGVLLASLLALLFGARVAVRRSPGAALMLDRILIGISAIGHSHYLGALGRLCRTLSLLLEARVPVRESMELAGAASGSPVLQRAMANAARKVEAGEGIADALSEESVLPRELCWFVSSSEERGDLETSLHSLADRYEAREKSQGQAWLVVLNFTLTLITGIFIAIFFIGVYATMAVQDSGMM